MRDLDDLCKLLGAQPGELLREDCWFLWEWGVGGPARLRPGVSVEHAKRAIKLLRATAAG